MLTNKEIAKLYICRRCLNEYAKIRFKNYELKYKYYYYHFKCSECGQMHHIVKGVKPLYAWKLFFIRKPEKLINNEDAQFEKHFDRRKKMIRLKRWLNL